MSDSVEQIKATLSIASVISKRVSLTKRGKNYIGLCPFHKEKTPSFNVDDQKGYFHCFGCGASGDIFEFVQKSEGIDFAESLKILAAQAGVELPKFSLESKEELSKKEQIFALNKDAADWFHSQLHSSNGEKAMSYVKKTRSLSDETIKHFYLGYAPNSYVLLQQYLFAKGYSKELIVESGLSYQKENGELNDRFRERLMFPIKDVQGRIIAFGGRILIDSEPKYLNSPETILFHKSNVLYGLYEAIKTRTNNDSLVVVEGYMDVISLHQAGFKEAVAPLGTALTESHAMLMRKYTSSPILCFDGDKAGLNASIKSVNTYLPLLTPDLNPKIAILPINKDPDDVIKESGKTVFNNILDSALTISQFIWIKNSEKYNLSVAEDRIELESELNKLINLVTNTIIKKHFLSYFKEQMFNITRTNWKSSKGSISIEQIKGRGETKVQNNKQEQIEIQTIWILLHFPKLFYGISEELSKIIFLNTRLDLLCNTILYIISEIGVLTYEQLKTKLEEDFLKEIIIIEKNQPLAVKFINSEEKALQYFNNVVYNHYLLLQKKQQEEDLSYKYRLEQNDSLKEKRKIIRDEIKSLSKQIEIEIKRLSNGKNTENR